MGVCTAEPMYEVCFGVALAKTVQPDKARAARRPDGCMGDIGAALDGIALFFQKCEEGCKGERFRKGSVYIPADKAADGGFALFFGVPLSVVFAFASWGDDGQIILPADGVGCFPDVSKVIMELVLILLSIHKGNGIKDNMAMEMGVIQVGGHDGLVFLAQQPTGKLHAQSVCLFRRDFAGGVGVDEVIPLYAACLTPSFFSGSHFGKRCLWETVDAVYKLSFRERGLGRIAGVLDAAIQTVVDDHDLIRCHYRLSFTSRQAS